MFDYTVVLQSVDGQTVEVPYSVHWDPNKVLSDEVAKACAIEQTMKYGKNTNGSFKRGFVPISATPQ